MFAPMSPLTERTRIQNEQQLQAPHETSFALPKFNMTALRKVITVRRPAMQRQPRTAAEASGC